MVTVGEHRGRIASAVRDARNAVVTGVVLGALILAGAMLLPPLLGYERYVITGGSMSGTYDRGSILYAQVVPVEEIGVGDVITYEPPAKAGTEGQVTHRVVSIREVGGERVLRTRGDANAAPDPWRFTLEGPEQARAAFSVPYVGYAFSALGIRAVRMAVIGLPAVLVAIALVLRLWRVAGEESRQYSAPAAEQIPR